MKRIESASDESVVATVVAGDHDAYAEIMARYEPKLQRYVVFLLHDKTLARDVVQDTFIKAYQNLQSFQPSYKFSSWVYRIAHNEAMNAIKKQRHLSGTDIDQLPEISVEPSYETVIDAKFLQADVQRCLAELEPKYREVVQLVYFEHMKYDEVSDILHVPTSTVGVWLSRAKKKLHSICQQKGVRQ